MTLITPEHSGPGVSVMVVVAHPDDAEFMCSGTVVKWAKLGKEITYVLATSGDKGSPDPSIPPQDLALIREDEQRRVCQLLGVTNVEFLRYPDGTLQNSLELRKSIVRLIRKYKPTAVITENPTARWVGNYINHPDHRAIGDATMDAVFPSARDIHMFPELMTEEGLGAHIVEHLYLGMMGDQANVFIDISDTIETKIAALRGHKSQMRDPTTNFDDEIRSMATRKDEVGNESYLETFRYFYLGS